MSLISFALDQYRLPVFEVGDPRYQPLGGWIITDISRDMLACLDGLAMADDITKGRAPFEPWSSENYEVSFTPEGFSFRNEWVEGDEARYSVAEIREALETYWRFLSALPERRQLVRDYHPELPEWQADLLRWEEKWGRPHPYRGRLF